MPPPSPAPGWGAPPPDLGTPAPGWGAPPATSGWGTPGAPPPTPPVGAAWGQRLPPQGTPPPAPPGDGTIGLGPNTRCYEHPDRLAGAICRSCDRPICTICMVQAPVGWHCHQCVRRNARKSPVIRYQPGRTGVPTWRQYPVTVVIIAVCVVLFVASQASPSLFVDPNVSPQALSGVWDAGLNVQSGEWYRLFTSIFFHLNVEHIGLNMLSLWVLGRLVEPALGTWRYLALFIVSGLGGSVISYLITNPLSAGVGASGAIFGLFGAYFVLARRASLNTSGIIALISINLIFGFVVPGIGWQAHVGGLITGLAVAAGFGLSHRRPKQQQLVTDVAIVAFTCAVLGLLMILPPGVVNLG